MRRPQRLTMLRPLAAPRSSRHQPRRLLFKLQIKAALPEVLRQDGRGVKTHQTKINRPCRHAVRARQNRANPTQKMRLRLILPFVPETRAKPPFHQANPTLR